MDFSETGGITVTRHAEHLLGDVSLAVSPSKAAQLSGIGRTKLYEAISSGDLPSFKIGTRRLIRVSALDAWLASLEEKAS